MCFGIIYNTVYQIEYISESNTEFNVGKNVINSFPKKDRKWFENSQFPASVYITTFTAGSWAPATGKLTNEASLRNPFTAQSETYFKGKTNIRY